MQEGGLKQVRVSVTGGFASGKSLFAKILSGGTVPVVNADSEGKKLLNGNIEEIFSYLNLKEEERNVAALKSAFLKDERTFIKYNAWMYERLPRVVSAKCMESENSILDAALVYEWGIEGVFDMNILILGGTFEERMERAAKQGREPDRNLYTLLEKHQMKDEERLLYADMVIENKGDEIEFISKAEELHIKIFSADR